MKELKDFMGFYSADEKGFIWSHRQNKYLKTFINNSGYKCLVLNTSKNPKKFLVHRLIAQTFISNPKNLPQVNHINCNKLDNRVENLEWVTHRNNISHAIKSGRFKNNGQNTPKGINNSNSKLNNEKVKQIRLLYSKGSTLKELGIRYNVSFGLIAHIVHGRAWKHIN